MTRVMQKDCDVASASLSVTLSSTEMCSDYQQRLLRLQQCATWAPLIQYPPKWLGPGKQQQQSVPASFFSWQNTATEDGLRPINLGQKQVHWRFSQPTQSRTPQNKHVPNNWLSSNHVLSRGTDQEHRLPSFLPPESLKRRRQCKESFRRHSRRRQEQENRQPNTRDATREMRRSDSERNRVQEIDRK